MRNNHVIIIHEYLFVIISHTSDDIQSVRDVIMGPCQRVVHIPNLVSRNSVSKPLQGSVYFSNIAVSIFIQDFAK